MKAVIFIPGYKGSFLKSQVTDKRHWITVSEVLFGRNSLGFDITESGISDPQRFISEGILDAIPILHDMFLKDIYRSFLEEIKTDLGEDGTIFPFSYDWRLSPLQHVQKLDVLIQSLIQEKYTDLTVIAHSLGGLILAYYLRYGSHPPNQAVETWSGVNSINKVVFAGVPFRGTLVSVRDIHVGEQILNNRSLLSKQALQTFPVAYHLLPTPGDNALCQLDSFELIDLYVAENWSKYHLGLFNNRVLDPRDHIRYLKFLKKQLASGKSFFSCINAPSSLDIPNKLKVINIIGNKVPTYSKFFWDTNNFGGKLIFNEKLQKRYQTIRNISLFEPGDGTVTSTSAKLPTAFMNKSTKEEVIAIGHNTLFHNEQIRSLIKNLVID